MSKKSILLIGPLSPPTTGVSICNDKIIRELSTRDGYAIDTINTANIAFNERIGSFSIKKVYFNIKQYLYLYKVFKANIVYLTIGQTFWGVLKSYPFILFSKLTRKKSIVHVHGNYLKTEYESLTGLEKKIFYKVLKKIDLGIVLSKNLKDNLTPFLPSPNFYNSKFCR